MFTASQPTANELEIMLEKISLEGHPVSIYILLSSLSIGIIIEPKMYQMHHQGAMKQLFNSLPKCLVLPLAGYALPSPPRGNFVDHIFLEAQCLARILQHVAL